MRLSVLTAASAFVLVSALSGSARADSLPTCPPGQRMDCHPGNGHHGCGGCVDIEPEPEDPAPEQEDPSPVDEQPVDEQPPANTGEASDDDEASDGGGGCSVGAAASLGALWVLTPFLFVFGASRIRRRR